MNGNVAFDKLINEYKFSTVLDIGCGLGEHTKLFKKNNKIVTSVNLSAVRGLDVVVGDYNEIEFAEPFDCIWASHVLEHQPNIRLFLKKLHQDLKEGGVLCITVPPLKHSIVGGHYSLWNAGILIYNLIMAGFNCKNISIKKYGYNISIILKKETVTLPQDLPSDKGEIEEISQYAPDFFKQNFYGDIHEYNWNDYPIFVHIPKTGGNSIIDSGVKISRWGHWNIRKIEQIAPGEDFENKFKFAFVRNPYDRLASSYFYIKNTHPGLPFHSVNVKYLPFINRFKDFNDFCLHLSSVKPFNHYNIFSLHHQYKYICDDDDNILVDLVVKIEDIDKEWGSLCERFNWGNVKFPHTNKSIREPFKNLYTSEMKKIVGDIYQKDFEIFKYDR